MNEAARKVDYDGLPEAVEAMVERERAIGRILLKPRGGSRLVAFEMAAHSLVDDIRRGDLDEQQTRKRLLEAARISFLVEDYPDSIIETLDSIFASIMFTHQNDVTTLPPDDIPPATDEADFGAPPAHERAELEPNFPDAKTPDQPKPLTFVDPTTWQDKPVPEREWFVPDRIPAAQVTLFSGDGAAGKTTIALDLAVACVCGGQWLGALIARPGPAIVYTGEEEEREAHFRLAQVLRERGLTFADLKGRLHLKCMPGEDSTFGELRGNEIAGTPLWQSLERAIEEIRPSFVMIEAATDVFGGDERNRRHASQFVRLLRRPAIKTRAALMLLSHPSQSGRREGTGESGSTQWHNSVRSRLYLKSLTDTGDGGSYSAERVLEFKKLNQGPLSDPIKLRWKEGVYVPIGTPSTTERAAAEASVDDAFLSCLDTAAAQGLVVSHAEARNYAPKHFEGWAQAKGFRKDALGLALKRLLSAGRVRVVTDGPPSRQRAKLVRSDGYT